MVIVLAKRSLIEVRLQPAQLSSYQHINGHTDRSVPQAERTPEASSVVGSSPRRNSLENGLQLPVNCGAIPSLRCRAISDGVPRMESCFFRVLLEENIVGMQVNDVRAMGIHLKEAMSEGEISSSEEGQPHSPL